MEFNLSEVNEAVAAAVPEREAIVWRDVRRTHAELAGRSRRLANYLIDRGLAAAGESDGRPPWESNQPHVALYMYNCPEYIEAMLGAFKARAVPVNVNYRYVADELLYLMNDSRAEALIYHAEFAPNVAEILHHFPRMQTLIQVPDDSNNDLLAGAVWYEDGLAAASDAPPPRTCSPDDLYVLYTGGTTGMPKGVLWRQADIFMAALGGRTQAGVEVADLDAIVAAAVKGTFRSMPTAPLMHAAHWSAFDALHAGNTVVLQDQTKRLDAASILGTAARERVHLIQIIGDAFARPLVDELEAGNYDLEELRVIVSGGAILSATVKEQMLALLPPQVRIIDTVGSSETGRQANQTSSRARGASTGTFKPGPGAAVLSGDKTRRLEVGDAETGWFAQSGRVPTGYLGDREKTEKTFPTVDGVRYSVPGDRARLLADGSIEVLGRDSVTINTGGEKVFAEEVEGVLKRHPAVYDAVVCGRPSERWGQEVVAVVQLRPGAGASDEELRESCAEHLARYKLPKTFIYRDKIERSPIGKPDYRWAVAVATAESQELRAASQEPRAKS